MFRTLRSTLPAVILSAALALGALGASTTQARADSRDAARVIGGVIALYALGRALENRDNDRRPSQHYHNPNRPPQYHVPQHRPVLVAPAQCYREFQTRHGYFRGYAGDCLQRNVHHSLPRSCAQEFRTNHGPRVFYGSHCMAQNGWVHEVRHRH